MHLLVIRTSAMGDVALLTPVLRGMREQYPDVEITLVTRKPYESFFYSIEGLRIFPADFSHTYKGFRGIFSLYSDLKKLNPDCILDMHDVLRTKVLKQLFRVAGTPVYTINKGRRDKRAVVRGKRTTGLKHSVNRYCDVFTEAGYPVEPSGLPSIKPVAEGLDEIKNIVIDNSYLNLAVAPYAKHKLKMWPEENMLKLLRLISERRNTRIWLFGGDDVKDKLKSLQASLPGSVVVTELVRLTGELALMSRLDLMISMDSSNMHMAALTGIRVVSIWGGTDPMNGFGAWKQPENMAIRIPPEELTCRPCTVYGKGSCRRGDLACLNWLTPEKVFDRLVSLKVI
jgi:ADP-heptose:LPS heptosyltransferase